MDEGCSTQKQVLDYLGERFRVKLGLPDWYSDEQAAKCLFEYVCFCLNWFWWQGREGLLVLCADVVGAEESSGNPNGPAGRILVQRSSGCLHLSLVLW